MKYVVHKDGKVFSHGISNGKFRRMKVNPPQEKQGYLNLCMSCDGKFVHQRVHRMVANGYILNPENKPHINHKNGIKNDNRVENLEWCTRKENQRHMWDNGLRNRTGCISERECGYNAKIIIKGKSFTKYSRDRSSLEVWLKEMLNDHS